MIKGRGNNGQPADLASLLGTKNRDEQTAKVQALLNAAQAPVVDLVIRFDARTQQVTLAAIGGRLAPDIVYFLLEQARAKLRAEELAAMASENTRMGKGAQGGENKPRTEEEEPKAEGTQ